MRKTLGLLGWLGVFLSIISLVMTLLTTYRFIYIKYFDSYCTFQWSLFFTMIVLAINMYEKRKKHRDFTYSVLCLLIAFGIIIFRIMKVY